MREKVLKNVVHLLWRCYSTFKLTIDYIRYQIRLPFLTKRIFSKDKIKVVFFPINIGMWKNDYLFELLLHHPRFEPFIVSFFVPVDSPDFQRRNQLEMRSYFQSKGYPYFDMYNFDTNEWFDIESFQPDIVFYTQPVDVSYPRYRIKSLWKTCIFYYIPYSLIIGKEKTGFNTLLYNISKKVFAPSEYIKNYWSSFFLNKARNVVVTGYPSFDYLTHPKKIVLRSSENHMKRIIWAPHHSIVEDDMFGYSNFLGIADKMIDLASFYKDQVYFIFKPHPRLRSKLESHKDWGPAKTNDYYNLWMNLPNTCLAEGEYFDLFLNSDAMIHDSITFIAEYLVTSKPVLFILKENVHLDLNEYGLNCFKQHYTAHTVDEIKKFIDKVVISGEDDLKRQRENFAQKCLLPEKGTLVSENIFNEIISELR